MPEAQTGTDGPSAGYPDDLDTTLDTDLRVFEVGRVVEEVNWLHDDKTGLVLATLRSKAREKIDNRTESPPETVMVVRSSPATPRSVSNALLHEYGEVDDLLNESDEVLEAVAVALERRDGSGADADPEDLAREVRALESNSEQDDA